MSTKKASHRNGSPSNTNPSQSAIDDLTRRLSVSGNSEGEMLRNLRNLNLGDDFWMYGFKVTPCSKPYSHKWSFCPCGHVGETAHRRDPRCHPYKATLCPLTKAKRTCPLGDKCLWSHNVFEHWLHPDRYKTRLCTFADKCNRAICFFAHSADELRSVPSTDENKVMEEREYLLQLMAAKGQKPQSSKSTPQLGNLGDLSSPPDLHFMTPQCSHRVAHRAATFSSSVHQPMAFQEQSSGELPKGSNRGPSHAELLYMQLHAEQSSPLPNVNSFNDGMDMMDPYGRMGGGCSRPPVRLSDPGLPHILINGMLNPAPHHNRMSDSGHALGMAAQYTRGIEASLSLESLFQSLSLSPMPQASNSPPRATPQPRMSYPGSCSSRVSPRTPPHSPQMTDEIVAQLKQTLDDQQQSCHLYRSNSSPITDQVDDLVAKLQDRGLGSTKEEVVASLSSLLAQLLSTM